MTDAFAASQRPAAAKAAHPKPRPRLELYVDETGDRGMSHKSSPYFALTGILVPGTSTDYLRTVINGLKLEFGLGKDDPLHWVDHLTPRRRDRREMATRMLASVPDLTVIHIVANKATMTKDMGMAQSGAVFYNYMARLLLERALMHAQNRPDGEHVVVARFGHVRGMIVEDSQEYLHSFKLGVRHSPWPIPWHLLQGKPKWHQTKDYVGIQAADIYAGVLGCALDAEFDDEECALLLKQQAHQIRRSWNGTAMGYGFKALGDTQFLTERSWWPSINKA
jgi:hypothetical protein